MRKSLLLLPLLLAGCQPAAVETPPPPPPGLSYAWVTFDASGSRASGASGLADRARGRPLTIDDPVRIASVSKLVVALGVMRLVEEGRIDLDSDVSRWLGWQLRNPGFPQQPITLRMLLSHTSSVKDEGDNYVVPFGRALQPMATDPNSFDGEHRPGTYFRYSNLNFPIIGSVLERATGERLDRLMERLVLKPLGLDACFNWTTCSDAKMARAVVLYSPEGSILRDDLGGKRPACPVASVNQACDLFAYRPGENGAIFTPQGGLRISAADLAKVGQLLLNRGRYRGEHFLREESIEAVLRPVWTFDGSNGVTDDGFYCAYGLAAQILPTPAAGCRDDLLGDGRSLVGHAGEAYGVRSGLWIDRRRNIGIAYFAANNGGDPPAGRTAYRAIEEWLAAKIRMRRQPR